MLKRNSSIIIRHSSSSIPGNTYFLCEGCPVIRSEQQNQKNRLRHGVRGKGDPQSGPQPYIFTEMRHRQHRRLRRDLRVSFRLPMHAIALVPAFRHKLSMPCTAADHPLIPRSLTACRLRHGVRGKGDPQSGQLQLLQGSRKLQLLAAGSRLPTTHL